MDNVEIALHQNIASNGRLIVLMLFAASLALWLFRGGESFMVCALLMPAVLALSMFVDAVRDEPRVTRYAAYAAAHVIPAIVFLFLLISVL